MAASSLKYLVFDACKLSTLGLNLQGIKQLSLTMLYVHRVIS